MHRSEKPAMWVRFPPFPPKQNSTAFSKPEGGTREARPKDSRRTSSSNSEFLARWRALIFRRGGGSSQRFLWPRPFSQKGLNQKQFCLYSVRLLTSFGKVRANHFACVKDCRFLPRATSFAKAIFVFLGAVIVNIFVNITIFLFLHLVFASYHHSARGAGNEATERLGVV